jgi:hypothetical protein
MSKSWEKWDTVPKEQAIDILSAIEKQLTDKFDGLRSEKYNQNTKGYDYEEIIRAFFEDYVCGAFEPLTRMGILDVELKVFNTLKATENEFDVVALHKDSVPRLVHRRLVPYDSVAFIIEVKQTMTLENLEKDLVKFSKLDSLKVNAEKRPLRVLFYYEAKAEHAKAFELLDKYCNSWDVCVILKENITYVSCTNEWVSKQFKGNKFVQDPDYPLINMMFFTCFFIQRENTPWLIFWNLIRSTKAVGTSYVEG